MKTILLVLGCAALLFQPAKAQPQSSPEPIKHGGKIETKYDGFNFETVMRLRKMKVNCDGLKDTFKNDCVSIEVALHCPGTQINYVRHVTLQVVFENKDWVHLHPPDQRDLIIVTDTETLRFGRMTPVSTNRPGTWDTKIEILEAKIPYELFKKIALSQSVGIQVGTSAVELREKNRAALKDLNSRVIMPATNASATN
ncbi:MAG TPA: hypothetical protein VGQ41_09345 [Pyrinomonadaceae bacterium]|jgi:hypothetical protein|nr:hypothetical protein [Pyrinomonadaceae bacterium]